MIILGIDPGTTTIGYGVVEHERNSMRGLTYGVICNSGQDKLADLKATAQAIGQLIKTHHPQALAVERLYFTNNQKTAMAVSEMRGVILLTAALHDLPVYEFTPLQVKQFISGYGRADKKQMQNVVRMLLNIKEPIRPDDAADALALAMCFSYHSLEQKEISQS